MQYAGQLWAWGKIGVCPAPKLRPPAPLSSLLPSLRRFHSRLRFPGRLPLHRRRTIPNPGRQRRLPPQARVPRTLRQTVRGDLPVRRRWTPRRGEGLGRSVPSTRRPDRQVLPRTLPNRPPGGVRPRPKREGRLQPGRGGNPGPLPRSRLSRVQRNHGPRAASPRYLLLTRRLLLRSQPLRNRSPRRPLRSQLLRSRSPRRLLRSQLLRSRSPRRLLRSQLLRRRPRRRFPRSRFLGRLLRKGLPRSRLSRRATRWCTPITEPL